jgi:predicted nucleic acid-binding Zn ribbon protein
MKYCPQCGTTLPKDALFCSECGSRAKKKLSIWRTLGWFILVPSVLIVSIFVYYALQGFLEGLFGLG